MTETLETVDEPTGPGAGARRGRPAQRRQVHPGQPDHRPPRGRGRGRAGRDPRPGVVRRQLGRPRVHRRRHRRLGPRRARAWPPRSRPRPRWRSPWPTRCCSWSTRPSASPTTTRPWSGSCASRGKPVVLAANKVDDQRTEAEAYGLWNLGLGEPYPVSALHGRGSGDLLDAVLAALPEPPPERERRGRRAAPDRDRRQAQRRQVLAAQPAGRPGAGRRRRRRRHHRRPGRRAGRAGRPDLAVHRHRRHPQAGQGGLGARVLRLAAHHDRDRPGRGRRAGARRLAVDLRAGPADHPDRPRGRPGAGDRVQQVGPGRRGAPLLPRPRDRARAGAGAVGAADQRHRAHRLARRPAGPGARQGAGGLGDPGLDRRAERLPRPAGRRAPAPGARRQAAQDHVRHPGRRPRRRRSCCSPAASSRRRTSGTSSGGCARSSASSARRSCCSSGSGRSAAGRVAGVG